VIAAVEALKALEDRSSEESNRFGEAASHLNGSISIQLIK
jgi:hypothetical protein